MDFTLRCNSLKCRRALNDRAVVTTCSHIFCHDCSNSLGFANAFANERSCPACGTALLNKDDAAETQLNPSEDYKTSILSGLSPTVIMECAGRGLAFYSYQVTQEVVYQEYLTKNLTDKNAVLNTQMDQVINDANAEILRLRNKLSAIEIDQEELRKKNNELFEAYSQKNEAHHKSQKMYDALKKRTLQTDVRYAAEDAANENSTHERQSQNPDGFSGSQRQRQQYPVDHRNIEQLHSRQKSGSSGDGDQGQPSFQKPRPVYGQPAWSSQGTAFGNGSTPAHQRKRLPVATPQTDRHSQYGLRPVRQSSQSNLAHGAAPPTRQPLGAMSANVVQGHGSGFQMGVGGGDGGVKQRKHRVPLMAFTYSTR